MRQSAILRTFVVLGPLLLSACAGPGPNTEAPPEVVVAPAPRLDIVEAQQQRLRERQQKIRHLLELAEQALAADRLRYPPEDNAFDWYQQVIELDELNADAHWGMKRITSRYFELAEEAYASGRPARAEALLKGALQVAATPAQVEALREAHGSQYRDNRFALSPQALSARNGSVRQQLADIARRAVAQESRLLIVARNDAEGRWIYKQMRDAVDGYRLRGNIEVGDHPHIQLIDL